MGQKHLRAALITKIEDALKDKPLYPAEIVLRSRIQSEEQETMKVWTVAQPAEKETRSQGDTDCTEWMALSQCYT